MAGVSSAIDLLTTSSTEPYTASASISDGVIDPATSMVTGDRSTGLFTDAASKLGKNDFLQLLVTQLQYQDPLNPMENTEFISQLAQFSALENSTNVEKAIGELDESFKSTVEAQQFSAQSMNNSAAVALIGKEVRLKQTTVDWYAKAGEKVTLNVHVGNSSSAVLEILNGDGEVVKTLEATGKDSQNSIAVTWDGSTDQGTVAESGTYYLHIVGEETQSYLYAFAQDMVEGVRFSSEGALVKIGGQELSISNVLDVSIGNGNGGSAGSLAPSTAVSLLGKQVRMRQTAVQFNQMDSERVVVAINAGNRSSVQVEMSDYNGDVVYRTTVPVGDDGVALLDWNGQMADGTLIEPGQYRIGLVGEDTDPTLYAFSEGVVSGIANLNGDARLRVGNYTVSLSNIIDIADVSEQEEAT